MIKIADMLAAQPRAPSTAAGEALPTGQKREDKDRAPAAVPAYPSKKLTLNNGQYVAADHEK